VSLPAWLSLLALTVVSLALNLLIINSYALFLSLWLKMIGWPRCIVLGKRSETGKICLIVVLTLLLIFLLKVIADFCKFGTCPDRLQKSLRMVETCCAIAWPHGMRSPAKSSERIGGHPGPMRSPAKSSAIHAGEWWRAHDMWTEETIFSSMHAYHKIKLRQTGPLIGSKPEGQTCYYIKITPPMEGKILSTEGNENGMSSVRMYINWFWVH
jgi:hypothetical protein